jgi:ADP-ribosylglycohydrolase
MTGYGTHNQPPGTWSDDSSMTLATLKSLAIEQGIFPDDIMKRFADWYCKGSYTPDGDVFDIGLTTSDAIQRYLTGTPPHKCGSTDARSNGNGALMRILPLAFTKCADYQIIDVAALTHGHPVSLDACIIYTTIAKSLLKGVPPEVAIFCAALSTGLPEYNRLEQLEKLSRDEIKSSGYVVDTLEAALWCLLKTDSYRDCVLTAVNLGDDTDTVAAIAGGLAGILYGVGGDKGIPEEWIGQVAKHDEIKALCEAFARRNGK